MKKIGLYIHIPFCKSKCYYCDFTSFANKEDLVQKYIQSVIKEIHNIKNNNVIVKTVYFGGGTPSFINEKYIVKVMDEIRKSFVLTPDTEISIEANPGTLTYNKLKTYYDCGINRLSVGLQTSNDKLLKEIGRIHTFKDYLKTIETAKEVGFTNINSDLIIGIPNQTIYDVEDSINTLIRLQISHISVYSLIVEENTKIEKMLSNNELKPVDDEIERYMYWFAKRKLEENRYVHYEISNFAKPGYYCRHNMDCWNQKEYLGVGVAASSYFNNKRFSNINCIEDYIKNIEENNFEKNRHIEEIQNEEQQMNEYMILSLRKIKGVDVDEFVKKFKKDPFVVYKDIITKLVNENLINVDLNKIWLTKKGIDFANIVWEEFV
jgi:oxygen-independent coproporphyrinogen-3 oxidase